MLNVAWDLILLRQYIASVWSLRQVLLGAALFNGWLARIIWSLRFSAKAKGLSSFQSLEAFMWFSKNASLPLLLNPELG